MLQESREKIANISAKITKILMAIPLHNFGNHNKTS